MNKNPFSFYDFLGYLFPGIVTLLIIVHVLYIDQNSEFIHYFKIQRFLKTFQEDINMAWWQSSLLLIIVSYIMGQIVSYLSSCTVEYFANRMFGYPSRYLFTSVSGGIKKYLYNYWYRSATIGNSLWRVITFFLFFPVSIFFHLLGPYLHVNDFIIRPLDSTLVAGIRSKINLLFEKLGLPELGNGTDSHRIVMHYVYLNIPNSQRKTDNYIALYGFLRTMTLIFCCYVDFLLIKLLSTINKNTEIDWLSIIIFIIVFAFCNIMFMSFVKFYRRFTLENYMALLTNNTK